MLEGAAASAQKQGVTPLSLSPCPVRQGGDVVALSGAALQVPKRGGAALTPFHTRP